jgi:hypothetical protein
MSTAKKVIFGIMVVGGAILLCSGMSAVLFDGFTR